MKGTLVNPHTGARLEVRVAKTTPKFLYVERVDGGSFHYGKTMRIQRDTLTAFRRIGKGAYVFEPEPSPPTVPAWVDRTSFSQNDKDRTPRTWTLQFEGFRVTVTRHIHYPGKWVLSCYELRMDCVELKEAELEKAQKEALNLVRRKLKAMLEQVRTAMGLPEES